MSTPFKINGVSLDGVHLPEPAHKGAVFSIQDIDSSETGRNQQGTLMRDRVATKIKWQLTFPPLSQQMLSSLLGALSSAQFSFTYPDPLKSSGTSTVSCYVGDRTAPVYSTSEDLPMWENVSFSIVQC